MKTTFKETKTYALLSAVFIITIMMLGSQLVPHQALSQGQASNNTASAQSNISSSVSIPLSKGQRMRYFHLSVQQKPSDSYLRVHRMIPKNRNVIV